MRCQSSIASLSLLVSKEQVPFPLPDPHRWTRFDAALRSVLVSNDLGNAWDFDPDEQCYFATFTEAAAIGGFRCNAVVHMRLDPKKPLAEEIPRVQAAVTAFKNACIVARHALETK